MSGSIQTLNQQRAEFALRCVERIKKLAEGRWEFLHDWEKIESSMDREIDLNSLDLEKVKTFIKRFGSFWEDLEEKIKKNEERKINYKKDYSSHAIRLPQLIVSNGLIPTLAFYKSKGKDRRQIYNDIELWLKFGANNGNGIISDKNKDLLEYLLEIDSSQLRLITMEALEFASWLKRMAEIELKEKGDKGNESE